MDVYYFSQNSNFGDHLNVWLWDAVAPDLAQLPTSHSLCGIGTLLGDLMPKGRRWLVMGSGTGYSPPPDLGQGEWHFAAVRGPLTARVLGLPADTAVTDSAILLAALPDGRGDALPLAQRHGVVFVPHWKQLRFGRWPEVCKAAGVEFIDPLQDSRQTLARVRAATKVLADAMHAAICADTVRVPWVAIRISSENHSFKWVDWTSGMALTYAPRDLPASTFLEKLQSDLSMRLGTDYRVDDTSVDAALQFHARTLMSRNSVSMAVRRRVVLWSVAALSALLRLPGLSGLRGRLDARQFDLAVQAMKAAALAPASLSEPAVFEARLAEMQRRLAEGLRQVRG